MLLFPHEDAQKKVLPGAVLREDPCAARRLRGAADCAQRAEEAEETLPVDGGCSSCLSPQFPAPASIKTQDI